MNNLEIVKRPKYVLYNGALYELIDTDIVDVSDISVHMAAVEHDGCKGCLYSGKKASEKPCANCKQRYLDHYEAKR